MRFQKMIEAKNRIASGFYDHPAIIDATVDRLLPTVVEDDFPDEQEISERLFLDASGYDN